MTPLFEVIISERADSAEGSLFYRFYHSVIVGKCRNIISDLATTTSLLTLSNLLFTSQLLFVTI
jgi:hypothetical protein